VFPTLRFHRVIQAFQIDPVAFFLSEGTDNVSEWNSRFQVGKIPSAPVLISPFVVRHQSSQDGNAYGNQVTTKRLSDEHFWKNIFLCIAKK
jgi:hypothetical protein